MTQFDSNHATPPTPEPLPAEFDRQQRAVDGLLAASAKMQSTATPMGLSQRVFEASIAHAGAGDLTIEAMPAEFDGDLQTIDAMLAQSASAHHDDVPLGLSQRVYEASVAHLPDATAETSSPLRLVGTDAEHAAGSPVSLGWSIWHRLSLAASVAIVGGIALWAIMQQPTVPGPLAGSGPGGAGSGQSDARMVAEISSQFDSLNSLTDDIGDFENKVAYLLDATQVLSLSDLNHDFGASTPGIDM